MIPLVDQVPQDRLTREEEADLVERAKRGDEDAANRLVMATMREALLYTSRTCRDRIAEDERTSLCYRKLMMCVKRFDPKRRLRFFAFCKPALRGYMKTFWENQSTVRNATEILSADRLSGWGHTGAAGSGLRPPSSWVQRRECHHAPFDQEDDRGESFREEITGEVELPATDGICTRDRWAEIERLLSGKLNSRQRMVLTLVYKSGLNFPEIAKYLDVTRSLIHAVHRKALHIIRNEVARDGRLLKE
jgi:RNA polymerase sigma factor (sigma-70 family)